MTLHAVIADARQRTAGRPRWRRSRVVNDALDDLEQDEGNEVNTCEFSDCTAPATMCEDHTNSEAVEAAQVLLVENESLREELQRLRARIAAVRRIAMEPGEKAAPVTTRDETGVSTPV